MRDFRIVFDIIWRQFIQKQIFMFCVVVFESVYLGQTGKEEREGCWDSLFAFEICEFRPLPSLAVMKTGAPV